MWHMWNPATDWSKPHLPPNLLVIIWFTGLTTFRLYLDNICLCYLVKHLLIAVFSTVSLEVGQLQDEIQANGTYNSK